MIVNETIITCCHEGCGISFAVPAWWEQKRRGDHTIWHCPNGHQQHFAAESAEEKLRRERDRLKQDIARADDEAREARILAANAIERATKSERTAKRLTKRAASGTCPCCNRSFSALSEHMKLQHPGFVKSTGAKVIPIKSRKRAA